MSLNGRLLGEHRGGYDPFDFDITDALAAGGKQELSISVWDPTDRGSQPRGKQVLKPGGIMYTANTGIWQTVWLEPVPETHIKSLTIIPDVDRGEVRRERRCWLDQQAESQDLWAKARDGDREIGTASGPASSVLTHQDSPAPSSGAPTGRFFTTSGSASRAEKRSGAISA